MRAPGLRASLIRGSLAILALCGVMAGQAQARVFIGFGFPLFFPSVIVPPPVYYPPYYGPPTGYPPAGESFNYTPPGYAPPGGQPQSLAPPHDYGPSRGYGPPGGGYTPSGGYAPSMGGGHSDVSQSCHAGAYVCPLVEDTPPGGACTCPGHGGQRIRGQAD